MVILEVRRVCLNIHRYDWWANLCFHKRMTENSITHLFIPERYQLKMETLQFGIYIITYDILIIYNVEIYKQYRQSLLNQLPNNASSQKDLLQKIDKQHVFVFYNQTKICIQNIAKNHKTIKCIHFFPH